MISVDDICNELQLIKGQASESINEIRHMGELAKESMIRAQSDFSEQQPGKTLLNALSLINIACDNAASSIEQMNAEIHAAVSKIKR